MNFSIKDKWPQTVLVLLAVIPALYGLAFFPQTVERFYSGGFYPVITGTVSRLTGMIPVSLAEFLLPAAIVFLLYKSVQLIRTVKKEGFLLRLFRFMINSVMAVIILYCLFMVMWGLNYHRLPFAVIAGMDTSPAAVEELTALCESLAGRAAALRGDIQEDQDGVMILAGGVGDVFDRAGEGYIKAAALYPELGGHYGRPKGVILSELMSRTGIWGMFFPFTGEANVNTALPHVLLPATACHEMAHQRGFAREDEANYIAWLTCSLHPDADFRYSGTVLALNTSLRTLARYDFEQFGKLRDDLDPGVRRDLAAIEQFSRQYSGPLSEASSRINNVYLKANNQSDGIYSYGRMVDLLIAEQRQKEESPK